MSSYQEAKYTLYTLGAPRLAWDRENRINAKNGIASKEYIHDPKLRTQTLRMGQRVGLTQADLDSIPVIHVAGTKGKGSTCHFVESILLSHGIKVGFFSSPHVLEETERIRINGRPISEETFANNFWFCYNKLTETKEAHNGEMPGFFCCLAIMAIRVFKLEQVDVAIMETGVGGEYDATNAFRSPVVCGITTLDLDHTTTLGKTLTEITWHKAGIFKPGVPAYTVMQPENSMEVLKERAREKKCDLKLVPSLQDYDFGGEKISLGIKGDIQRINASLALQLCKEWLNSHSTATEDSSIRELGKLDNHALNINNYPPVAPPFVVSPQMKRGLQKCFCPGRSQVINRPGLTYYLDVAHTPKSIQECLIWFSKSSKLEHKGDGVVRIAMIGLSSDRDPKPLLERIIASGADFEYIVFTPGYFEDEPITKAYAAIGFDAINLDNVNKMDNTWKELLVEKSKKDGISKAGPNGDVSQPNGDVAQPNDDVGIKGRRVNLPILSGPKAVAFYSLNEAIYWVSGGRDSKVPLPNTQSLDIPKDIQNAKCIQVLVTCSFKLVANVISTVDPRSLDHQAY